MAASRNDEKANSSDNYIKVNVWGGKIGHASLEVFDAKRIFNLHSNAKTAVTWITFLYF